MCGVKPCACSSQVAICLRSVELALGIGSLWRLRTRVLTSGTTSLGNIAPLSFVSVVRYHMTMKQYPAKQCQICQKTWQPTNRYQSVRNKTCSPKCAGEAISQAKKGTRTGRTQVALVACTECGRTIEKPLAWLKRVKNPTCSRQCNGKARGRDWATHGHEGRAGWTEESRKSYTAKMSGENNPAWNGGVTYWRKKGNYPAIKYVRAPQWAIPMARKDGYIMEHRLLMAMMCGRLLTRKEVVNHINRNPLDNTLTNLELYPTNGDHKRGEVGRFVDGVANQWSRRSVPAP